MKKIIITLLYSGILTLANASIPQKIESINSNPITNKPENKSQELENQYLRDVYSKVPEMQDEGTDSNVRSEKEGAALQLIMTTGISRTGFSKDDFAHLLNEESIMVKEYVKGKKVKGYLMIENILLFTKGYPDLPAEALNEFKKHAECQNGYCVYVSISSIKQLNEKQEEVKFDQTKFMKIVAKHTDKSRLWEVKPTEIPEEYKNLAVKVISGYGLGGLDALDLAKKKPQ